MCTGAVKSFIKDIKGPQKQSKFWAILQLYNSLVWGTGQMWWYDVSIGDGYH